MKDKYVIFEQNSDNHDNEYLAWIKANNGGYVINTRRSKPVNYRVLHRASCRFIKNNLNNKIEGAFTQRAYIKICATEVISLKMWADKEHPRGVLYSKKCMRCAP